MACSTGIPSWRPNPRDLVIVHQKYCRNIDIPLLVYFSVHLLAGDPRINIELEVQYKNLTPRYRDTQLDYFIILPFVRDFVNTTNVNTQSTTPDSWKLNDEWLSIISEGYGIRSFSNLDELLRFFYVEPYAVGVDTFVRLNLAIRDYTISASGTPVPSYDDDIVPIRFLYNALSIGGAKAHVVFYNMHSTNTNTTLTDIFAEILGITTYLKNVELFVSAGIDSSRFTYNPSFRNQIVSLYHLFRNYEYDIMYVFDSRITVKGHEAYQEFLNQYPHYNAPSPKDYNKILLSGWYRYNNHILPPSLYYLILLVNNYNRSNRFESVVNKRSLIFKNARLLDYDNPKVIRDEVFDNLNLLEGKISTANRLYSVRESIPIFLTDYTLLRERNIMRYENAVRAALYGKKKVETIMSKYIGLRSNEIDLMMMEKLINEELKTEIDLQSFVVIPKEQSTSGQITAFYYITVGVTTYSIQITVTATD